MTWNDPRDSLWPYLWESSQTELIEARRTTLNVAGTVHGVESWTEQKEENETELSPLWASWLWVQRDPLP